MTWRSTKLLWLVVMLVMDGVLTFAAMHTPGMREINPVISHLMKWVGLLPALVLTRGGGFALALLVDEWMLNVIVGVETFVVVWNLVVLSL